MPFPRFGCVLALAFAASGAARAETPLPPIATALTVSFVGLESRKGPVMMALFTETSWKDGTPILGQMLYPAGNGAVRTIIVNVPPGRYGIKAYRDLNGNGKLDTNMFGVPSEPYAFSNNAHGTRGPAVWKDASFALAPGGNAQVITIR